MRRDSVCRVKGEFPPLGFLEPGGFALDADLAGNCRVERVGRGFTLTFFPKTLGNNQVNDGRATHLLAVAVGEQVSSRIEQCHGLAVRRVPLASVASFGAGGAFRCLYGYRFTAGLRIAQEAKSLRTGDADGFARPDGGRFPTALLVLPGDGCLHLVAADFDEVGFADSYFIDLHGLFLLGNIAWLFATLINDGLTAEFVRCNQRVANVPDGQLVKIQRAVPACFQGLDSQLFLGDFCQGLFCLVVDGHGSVSFGLNVAELEQLVVVAVNVAVSSLVAFEFVLQSLSRLVDFLLAITGDVLLEAVGVFWSEDGYRDHVWFASERGFALGGGVVSGFAFKIDSCNSHVYLRGYYLRYTYMKPFFGDSIKAITQYSQNK